MAGTSTDEARDSREWQLPEYLEPVDGGVRVRLDRLTRTKVVTTLVTVMIAVAVPAIVAPDFIWWVVAGVFGVLVLCAAPILVVWWWHGGVIPVARVRLAARIELVAAIALTVVAIACGVWAAVRDLAVGEFFAGTGWYRLVAFLAAIPVIFLSQFTGWLLRVARRVDPRTPPAVLPGDRSIRGMYTTDYGEAGVRFPKMLPVALVAPLLAVAWLSVVFANLTYGGDDVISMVMAGCSMGLVPLVVGVSWWPWLSAVLSRGLRPEQVRAVGLTQAAGGCVAVILGAAAITVSVSSHGDSNAAPGMLAVLFGGGTVAVAGGLLAHFGNQLRRIGLHPADTDASTVDSGVAE